MIILNDIKSILESSNLNSKYEINNEFYSCNILFFNPDGKVFNLSKNTVKNLNINDNVFEPYTKCSLSFIDDENSFERLKNENNNLEFDDNDSLVEGFTFRGDGRDFVYIEIIPIKDATIVSQGDKYNNVFGFRNLYSVIKSVDKDTSNGKLKTIHLMDIDEKNLSEKKSFFSTKNLLQTDKPLFLLSNKEREVETGTCMLNLLKDVLGYEDEKFITNIDETGETPDFEKGLSKIFYTSPAENTALKDLMYLYEKNVSNNSNNDFSILKKDLYNGLYSLKSMSGIFKTAYNKSDNTPLENNIEKLIITGKTNASEQSNQNTLKTPSVISFGEMSDIQTINFFNTDSLINSKKIVTNVLHSYDFNNKIFKINKKDSDITNIKNIFKENYVNDMKGSDDSPFPNMVLNETKTTNKSFQHNYSLYGENKNILKGEGINKLLKSSLITNLGAEIIVKGQMFRKTGNFISIDRNNFYVDNTFDDKFLGIYFILNVEHNFIEDTKFENKILAVKTYIYKDPKFKEDTI
jgi:hypothetical protein|tara:strand:- start:1372 stop:2937 length:1566 start_codon:yes stop_codon:yes gene_type:complete